METVRLAKDGGLTDPGGLPASDPLPLLPLALRLDADCVLRSFFAMLIRYPDLQKLSRFLPAAVAEAEVCPASGCMGEDVATLVLGKTMELIGFPGEPRAEVYPWLRGLAPQARDATPSSPDGFPGGLPETAEGRGAHLARLMEADREIRFIPIKLLLDTPLVLAGLKHVVFGDVSRSLFCESRFTLFEVIDGLAWEIGFQGGSEQCSLGR